MPGTRREGWPAGSAGGAGEAGGAAWPTDRVGPAPGGPERRPAGGPLADGPERRRAGEPLAGEPEKTAGDRGRWRAAPVAGDGPWPHTGGYGHGLPSRDSALDMYEPPERSGITAFFLIRIAAGTWLNGGRPRKTSVTTSLNGVCRAADRLLRAVPGRSVQAFGQGTEGKGRQEGEEDQHERDPEGQRYEHGAVGPQRARGDRHRPPPGQASRQAEDEHHRDVPAQQHDQGQGDVVERRAAGQAAERGAVAVGRAGERVHDLGKPVCARVPDRGPAGGQ